MMTILVSDSKMKIKRIVNGLVTTERVRRSVKKRNKIRSNSISYVHVHVDQNLVLDNAKV